MSNVSWTCPYCDKPQIVTIQNRDVVSGSYNTGDKARLGIATSAIRCLNTDCGETTVTATVKAWIVVGQNWAPSQNDAPRFSRSLLPEGAAKPLPDFIPRAIRDDYREACLIRELSPKASATLARRCLQGMIRDFAKPVAKNDKLFEEIKALETAITDGTAPREISQDSVAALTAVRKIGNIGAHMEADVDVIVEVDAGEAKVLIELIESLLQDWYVERHKRQQRFAATVALGAQKAQELRQARSSQPGQPLPERSGASTAGEADEQ